MDFRTNIALPKLEKAIPRTSPLITGNIIQESGTSALKGDYRCSYISRKHAYTSGLPYTICFFLFLLKNENFQIKKSDMFHISAQKHRLWVFVRNASSRLF